MIFLIIMSRQSKATSDVLPLSLQIFFPSLLTMSAISALKMFFLTLERKVLLIWKLLPILNLFKRGRLLPEAIFRRPGSGLIV